MGKVVVSRTPAVCDWNHSLHSVGEKRVKGDVFDLCKRRTKALSCVSHVITLITDGMLCKQPQQQRDRGLRVYLCIPLPPTPTPLSNLQIQAGFGYGQLFIVQCECNTIVYCKYLGSFSCGPPAQHSWHIQSEGPVFEIGSGRRVFNSDKCTLSLCKVR